MSCRFRCCGRPSVSVSVRAFDLLVVNAIFWPHVPENAGEPALPRQAQKRRTDFRAQVVHLSRGVSGVAVQRQHQEFVTFGFRPETA